MTFTKECDIWDWDQGYCMHKRMYANVVYVVMRVECIYGQFKTGIIYIIKNVLILENYGQI